MLRIPVDFNAMTSDRRRVQINKHLNEQLLNNIDSGSRVILYTPNELEVEGTIEIDQDENGTKWWYGVPDWSTVRDLPSPGDK
jgi:hypothetical protein